MYMFCTEFKFLLCVINITVHSFLGWQTLIQLYNIYPGFFSPHCMRMGCKWQQVKQLSPDIPFASSVFQLLLRDPETFLGQMRYIISSACSGSAASACTS